MGEIFKTPWLRVLRMLLSPIGDDASSGGGNGAYTEAQPAAVGNLDPGSVVLITVSDDCFYQFSKGQVTPTTARRVLLRGAYRRIVPAGCDTVAVIGGVDGATGVLGTLDVQRIDAGKVDAVW